MDFRKFLQSHLVARVIIIIFAVLVLLVVFQAGIIVGYHKAAYSYNWNSNYFRGMTDPRSMLAPFMHDSDDLNPHGAIGEIVSVHLPMIMIKGPNSAETVVLVSSSTAIRYMHEATSSGTLIAGMQITAIGEPNESGQLVAGFIRILPKDMLPPPSGNTRPNAPGTSSVPVIHY